MWDSTFYSKPVWWSWVAVVHVMLYFWIPVNDILFLCQIMFHMKILYACEHIYGSRTDILGVIVLKGVAGWEFFIWCQFLFFAAHQTPLLPPPAIYGMFWSHACHQSNIKQWTYFPWTHHNAPLLYPISGFTFTFVFITSIGYTSKQIMNWCPS